VEASGVVPQRSASIPEVLDKAVWTDDDFDEMGWHDATLYAVGFPVGHEGAELVLDLDYIVRWAPPEPPEQYYSFWVAPATLVFHEVAWGVKGEIDAQGDLELDGITRDADGTWTVEGHNFDLTFAAAGFHQYFRSQPMDAGTSQSLGDRRGPVSFARPTTFGEP
jgi:hypothetical protein